MAKKKTATKTAKAGTPPAQNTVLVYVPDAIYNLGPSVQHLIGAMNFHWAKAFGVQTVKVDKNSSWP